MEQRSPEWFSARLGNVTASRIKDVMARTQSGPSASRQNYLAELVAERLTGVSATGFENAAMKRGTDMEPLARNAYEARHGVLVDIPDGDAAYVPHPTILCSGASPDGYVDTTGLVEIKCPNTATHLRTLLGGSIDQGYIYQMQWQMACTERVWCDFVSFDDRLPDRMQLHVTRVMRDDKLLADIESKVTAFLRELHDTIEQLKQRFPS